jgi:hypothetical protein
LLKKSIIFLLCVLIAQISISQSYVKNIGNPGIDDGLTCLKLTDDKLFVSGYSGKQTYLAMLDLDGELIWKKYFQFSDHRNFISDILIEGNTIVLCGYGHNAGTAVFDEFFVKYNYVDHKIVWARKTALNIKPNNIHLYKGNYIITGDEFAKGKFGLCFLNLAAKNGRVNDFTTWYYTGHESASNSMIIEDKLFVGGRYGLRPKSDKYRASISQFELEDFSQVQSNYFLNSKQDEARAYLSDFVASGDTIVAACYSNNTGIDNKYSLSLLSTLKDGTVNWAYEYVIPGYSSLTVRDMAIVDDGYYVFGYTKSPEEQLLLSKFDKQGYPISATLIGGKYNENVFMDQGRFLAIENGHIYLGAQSKSLGAMGDYDSFVLKIKENEAWSDSCMPTQNVKLKMLAYEELIEGSLYMSAYDTTFKEMNIAFQQGPSKSEINQFACKQIEVEPPMEEPEISFKNIAFNNTVFLMDASLSMNRADRMPILKKSLYRLLNFMRAEDEISAVSFSDQANVVLDAVSASQADEIRLQIDSLASSGQSDVIAGLQLGLKLAKANFSEEANNRIILTTDGDLSFGKLKELSDFLKKNPPENIAFTIFLFNNSSTYFNQLQEIADEVNGEVFVVNRENIEEILLNELRAKKQ